MCPASTGLRTYCTTCVCVWEIFSSMWCLDSAGFSQNLFASFCFVVTVKRENRIHQTTRRFAQYFGLEFDMSLLSTTAPPIGLASECEIWESRISESLPAGAWRCNAIRSKIAGLPWWSLCILTFLMGEPNCKAVEYAWNWSSKCPFQDSQKLLCSGSAEVDLFDYQDAFGETINGEKLIGSTVIDLEAMHHLNSFESFTLCTMWHFLGLWTWITWDHDGLAFFQPILIASSCCSFRTDGIQPPGGMPWTESSKCR